MVLDPAAAAGGELWVRLGPRPANQVDGCGQLGRVSVLVRLPGAATSRVSPNRARTGPPPAQIRVQGGGGLNREYLSLPRFRVRLADLYVVRWQSFTPPGAAAERIGRLEDEARRAHRGLVRAV